MREVLSGRLWIGHANDARSPRCLLEAGVRAVVDVAIEEPPASLPREMTYVRFPLVDGEGNDSVVLRLAVSTVVGLLDGEVPTLVACSAGLSRSPTLASFALAGHERRTPQQALVRIAAAGPVRVNAVLWQSLEKAVQPSIPFPD